MPHPFALALPSTAPPRPETAREPTRRPPGFAARGGADDAELMAWAGAGDCAAFDLLVARHGERALRLALRVVGDPAEAEDVAQEAFLRAWRAAARFDPGRARVSTWLHRIVLNLAIDRTRRRRAAPQALRLAEGLPDPAAGPGAGLDAAAERAALDAALAELPPRQRAAVALAYEDGLSGAEAAAALSLSERALEGLLRRARLLLRTRLGGGGGA
jgi:RNA polymerase sigma-70 factor, ECF subfamily